MMNCRACPRLHFHQTRQEPDNNRPPGLCLSPRNTIRSFALRKCRHVKIWKDDIKEERWTGWRRAAWDNKIKAVQELRWIDESIEWRWQAASQRRGQWRRISLRRNDAFKRAKAGRVGSLAGREKRGIWAMHGWGEGTCRWSGDMRNILNEKEKWWGAKERSVRWDRCVWSEGGEVRRSRSRRSISSHEFIWIRCSKLEKGEEEKLDGRTWTGRKRAAILLWLLAAARTIMLREAVFIHQRDYSMNQALTQTSIIMDSSCSCCKIKNISHLFVVICCHGCSYVSVC